MTYINIGEDDWATGPMCIRIPGIADKVYTKKNSGIGIACHSVVGSEPRTSDGVPNRFLSLETYWDADAGVRRYTSSAAASVTFVLRNVSTKVPGYADLIVMYPITASTWTSGGPEGNTSYIAIEMEGGPPSNPGEPMTDEQLATFVLLVRAIEARKGIKYIPMVNMLEHRHIAAKYGYAATACASGRYKRGWDALMAVAEEEDVPLTLAQVREMIINESIEQDDRLREVMAWRNAITRVMSHPDAEVVRLAYNALEDADLLKYV